AAIVHNDANLETAIPSLLKGGFYHAGQVCVSTQNVYLHRGIYEEVTARLKLGVEKLRVGDPTSPDTDVGPLISQGDVERVHAWVTEATSQGSKLVTGGHPLDHQCYAPTLLRDTKPDTRVVSHEIFGPVLCLQPYDKVD